MITKDWLLDAVLYVYVLSLLFYAQAAASSNRSAMKMGTGLLGLVWLMQTGFVIALLVRQSHHLHLTTKDFLFVVSWLLVLFSLWLGYRMRANLVVLIINVVGFAVLALNLLDKPQTGLGLPAQEPVTGMLFLHVTLMMAAFSLLSVAAILSGIYVYMHLKLKRKVWSPAISRLPGLETLERYIFRSGAIGVPLLLLSLSTGTAALLASGMPHLMWGAKGTISTAAGIFYIMYLIRRSASRDDGKRLAYWHLLGYATLVAALCANLFSAFQPWI